ncbi:3,4-dioxygenase subunit beta [Nocardioides sp.]|uniref:dioxygenase family protein n=1 Tax=Nocardioides sp. TaxID=35761 RepID=UPI003D0C23E5
MSNHHDQDDELHDHDKGLAHDLPTIVSRGYGRRGMLGLLGGIGVATVAGCSIAGSDASTATTAASSEASTAASTAATDGEIPEETAGPYPADGSNGVDVLSESGIIRQDITSSFAGASGVAEGVPLTINLTLVDLNGTDVAPLSGAAVYLWHCNRDGEYSMYSEAIVEENYLRGVQESDSAGALTFTSIFPAAYDGRWPHIHFEVYPSVEDATTASNKLRTSQIALPEDACQDVYDNADGYDASAANLQSTSLDTDMVFSDGYSLQMAKLTGSVDEGYVATLNVPI